MPLVHVYQNFNRYSKKYQLVVILKVTCTNLEYTCSNLGGTCINSEQACSNLGDTLKLSFR